MQKQYEYSMATNKRPPTICRRTFQELLLICVCTYFPFGVQDRIVYFIVQCITSASLFTTNNDIDKLKGMPSGITPITRSVLIPPYAKFCNQH